MGRLTQSRGSRTGVRTVLLVVALGLIDAVTVAAERTYHTISDHEAGNHLQADSVVVNTGANGVCQTKARNDDTQFIPVNQGKPDAVAITAGTNGVLDRVLSGDDGRDGHQVKTGSDGICQTAKNGDDVQVIAVGKGSPSCVAISPGENAVLNTTPQGDDTVDGNNITTGPDGICNTTKQGDDVQVIAVNSGQANSVCITPGANAILDPLLAGDDGLNGSQITTGTNGIRQSANVGDDVPVINIGNGEAYAPAIKAGTNAWVETVCFGDDVQVVGVGHFSIVYQTDGDDAPPVTDADGNGHYDFVEKAGDAFEDAWYYIVNLWGFPSPPGKSETNRVNVTIEAMQYLGTCDPSSNIKLKNDLNDGHIYLVLTVATHEFFHAVQLHWGWATWDGRFLNEGTAEYITDEPIIVTSPGGFPVNNVNLDDLNLISECAWLERDITYFDGPWIQLSEPAELHHYGTAFFWKYLAEQYPIAGSQRERIKDVWVKFDSIWGNGNETVFEAINKSLGGDADEMGAQYIGLLKKVKVADYLQNLPGDLGFEEEQGAQVDYYDYSTLGNDQVPYVRYNESANSNIHIVDESLVTSIGQNIWDIEKEHIAGMDGIDYAGTNYYAFKVPKQVRDEDCNTDIHIWFNGDGAWGDDWRVMLIKVKAYDANGKISDAEKAEFTLDGDYNGMIHLDNFGKDVKEVIVVPINIDFEDDDRDELVAFVVTPLFQAVYTPSSTDGTTSTVLSYPSDDDIWYRDSDHLRLEVDVTDQVHVGDQRSITFGVGGVNFSAESWSCPNQAEHKYRVDATLGSNNSNVDGWHTVGFDVQSRLKLNADDKNSDSTFQFILDNTAPSIACSASYDPFEVTTEDDDPNIPNQTDITCEICDGWATKPAGVDEYEAKEVTIKICTGPSLATAVKTWGPYTVNLAWDALRSGYVGSKVISGWDGTKDGGGKIAPGKYYIYAEAKDPAGNQGENLTGGGVTDCAAADPSFIQSDRRSPFMTGKYGGR